MAALTVSQSGSSLLLIFSLVVTRLHDASCASARQWVDELKEEPAKNWAPTHRTKSLCRADWQQYEGSCYRSVTTDDRVNWHDAQWLCYNYGGHLLTIASDEEYKYVTNLLKWRCPAVRHGYLGYHNTMDDWHFTWVDGTSSTFTKWDRNKHNNDRVNWADEHCGAFSVGTWWENVSCVLRYESCFLCKHTPSCPDGWTPFGGRCYRQFVHSTKVAWDGARKVCQTVGADLASINSEEDQSFLDSLMQGRNWYFIGYSNVASKTIWRWVDGSEDVFTNWANGEPSKAPEGDWSRNCAAAKAARKWKRVRCSSRLSRFFACKF